MDFPELKLSIILASIVIFGLLEHLFAFYEFKTTWQKMTLKNFALGIFNALFTSLLLTGLLAWIWQQNLYIGPFLSLENSILVGSLSFLILDCYMYFWHRTMHETKLGWLFHQVHHSDLVMNSSSAYRFHLIEVFFSNLPKFLIVFLLGIAPLHYFIYELAFTIIIIFHHSNWALNQKIDWLLSKFIVTPNLHRVHHSKIPAETNSNYSSVFIIWDKLFKSFQFRTNPEKIKIGLKQYPKDLSLIELFKLPFKK